MAKIKISDLPQNTAPAMADDFPHVATGITKRAEIAQYAAFTGQRSTWTGTIPLGVAPAWTGLATPATQTVIQGDTCVGQRSQLIVEEDEVFVSHRAFGLWRRRVRQVNHRQTHRFQQLPGVVEVPGFDGAAYRGSARALTFVCKERHDTAFR